MSQGEDELFAVLESVHNEETFLQFLLALRDDREASVAQEKASPSSPFGPDARGWENTTIERFFNAAVVWARASSKGLPLLFVCCHETVPAESISADGLGVLLSLDSPG